MIARAKTTICDDFTTQAVTAQSLDRARLIAEARSWLGTPFHHGAKLNGVGVDCGQLLIACYCDTGLAAPVDPGYYAPDWFRHERVDRLRGFVAERCMELPGIEAAQPGDILLFRYGRFPSHAAILVDTHAVIHSFRGRGVIEESCAPGTPLAARFVSAWSPWGEKTQGITPCSGIA